MSSYDEYPGGYPAGRDYPDHDAFGGQPPASGRATVGRASVPGAVDPQSVGDPYLADPYAANPHAADPYAGGAYGYAGDAYGQVPPGPAGPSGYGYGGDPYASSQDPYSPQPASPGYGADPYVRTPPGRASVRPTSPAGGPSAGGPGGRGPGGRGPGRSGGRTGGDRPGGSKRSAKKARRRNLIISLFAVVIMLTGAGLMVGTYYVDSVKSSEELQFPDTSTIYFADGKTVLAKLGENQRYPLEFKDFNDAIKDAIVASEDKSFWTNPGIDFTGVVRAAWNNFTGGSTQGGSTITQQYARLVFDLDKSTSYTRKAREAVLAWKLTKNNTKEEILQWYLNSVEFGRHARGAEAAAQVFFGKTVNRNAKPEQQITKAEAMALVLMVKQPYGTPEEPGYDPKAFTDPKINLLAEQSARGRFEYVRGQMLALNYLTPAESTAVTFPLASFKPKVTDESGMSTPTGMVIRHVQSELIHGVGMDDVNAPFKGHSWEEIKGGGYKIFTTIDPRAQQAAIKATDRRLNSSILFGQPANLQGALVAVEPGTGRVLAYYGGQDPKGSDFAGIYREEDGTFAGYGSHPPGSTFKVYTLGAALKAGISLNSWWDSTGGKGSPPKLFEETKREIRNASLCTKDYGVENGPCTLMGATVASLNTPFYAVTINVTVQKVLEMAKAAGIDSMWTDAGNRIDLAHESDMGKFAGEKFDVEAGIGQYKVTVADHANGMATFAAGGLRSRLHFVTKVMDGQTPVYSEVLPSDKDPRILNPQQISDETWALEHVGPGALSNGWESARKTGTWQLGTSETATAHAWIAGYTRKLAAAVWVGNGGAKETALKTKGGADVFGSTFPAPIFKQFMDETIKAMGFKSDQSKFDDHTAFTGDETLGNTPSPTPSSSPTPSPTDTACLPPATSCPSPTGTSSAVPTAAVIPSKPKKTP